jgi:hypothetical protein
VAIVKISAICATCGVRVEGEVETSSREFVHRFYFPEGVAGAIRPAATEVAGTHLSTFAPDSKNWFVPCPLCEKPIRFDSAIPRRT